MSPTPIQLKKKIKSWLIFLMAGLVLSGITAFPIESELAIAINNIDMFSPKMQHWLTTIYTAVKTTNAQYPYLSYGTDWLAFAHIVIAIAFIGPLRNPVRNIWVLQFGMIACVLIFPLAFIAGPIRHIPLFWQLVDCSFGVIGVIPLYIACRYTYQLEILENTLKNH
ncbi:hypothetical protein IDJ75_19960 [Mucilaginibacter rigui]|uniref:Uncharacterized protein n=1 Tax=Mucilaginibacter rigui TaxID=534635 RepID=A0ABR7XD57_9SPHI|nr:hypothetical protein [Mucilaginibacter rigui]MBD1387570.1 hypothetical protein [Mucilaginibacter rigui]